METADRVNELSATLQNVASQKRKLEADIGAMNMDLEEMSSELRRADDAAKKATLDASRLVEELRSEKDHSSQVEKIRRTLETQLKEVTIRLDDAEAKAAKGGKSAIAKLEGRVLELESELDSEQRRHAETQKNMRKADRRLKELGFQVDEDRKNQERLQDLIDKLQAKIKTYKRQAEEAEEVAAINLAKYRKVADELESAEERADSAENNLQKVRIQNRSMSASRATGSSSSSTTIVKRTKMVSQEI